MYESMSPAEIRALKKEILSSLHCALPQPDPDPAPASSNMISKIKLVEAEDEGNQIRISFFSDNTFIAYMEDGSQVKGKLHSCYIQEKTDAVFLPERVCACEQFSAEELRSVCPWRKKCLIVI